MASPRTALLLAHQADIPTQVLYALRAAGYRVAVLGSQWTKHFQRSRHVTRFEEMAFDVKGALVDPEGTARAIDAAAKRAGADIIVPGDWITAPTLCAALPYLVTATFPMPSFDTYGRLADKTVFARIAAETGVPVPQTIVVSGREALDADAIAASVGFPAIVKPAQGGGGAGVTPVAGPSEVEAIRDNPAYPGGALVVQSYIVGEDVDCSILIRNGRLEASAVQAMRDGILHFLYDDELASACAKMAAAVGFEGIAHFDARRAASDKRLYLIECNPRPWRSINAAQLCGLNFIALGLQPPGDSVRTLAGRAFANPRQLGAAISSGRLGLGQAWPSLANALRPFLDPQRARAERSLHREWQDWKSQQTG